MSSPESSSVISRANALTEGIKLNLSICKAAIKSAAMPSPAPRPPVKADKSNNPPGAASTPSKFVVPEFAIDSISGRNGKKDGAKKRLTC